MNFSTQNMPSAIFSKTDYNVTVDQFRAMEPSQRRSVMARFRDKEQLKDTISQLIYSFGGSLQSKTFIKMSVGLGERVMTELFTYFACMAVPLSKNMTHVDMRNEASAKFYKALAEVDFENATATASRANFSFCGSSSIEITLQEQIDAVFSQIRELQSKIDLTAMEVAQVFATAFLESHNTTQQCFTGTMYQVAQRLHQMHSCGDIQIETPALLQIVTAITSLEDHYFPYV